MPRRDPEVREPAARERDLGVALRIEPLAPLDAWLEEAERLELPSEHRVDSRALAELVEVELALRVGKPGRSATLPFAARARCELVADYVQRQELIPLQAQDRLQALDVVLAE